MRRMAERRVQAREWNRCFHDKREDFEREENCFRWRNKKIGRYEMKESRNRQNTRSSDGAISLAILPDIQLPPQRNIASVISRKKPREDRCSFLSSMLSDHKEVAEIWEVGRYSKNPDALDIPYWRIMYVFVINRWTVTGKGSFRWLHIKIPSTISRNNVDLFEGKRIY